MTKHKKTTNYDNCNHEEHKSWNRRSFIQAMGLVGASSMAFANSAISVSKPSALTIALDQAETDNVLILIRLKGGNDGLNTIVPLFDYDTYANARPSIKLAENELFNLSDDFGMANYANQLERMWGDGKMKVVHGVGYENPTLSHFNSSDVWATASNGIQETTGWLGRYFEEQYPDYLLNPPAKPTAIQIGGVSNILFDGENANYAFTVGNPTRLAEIAESGELTDLSNLPNCRYGEKLGFIKGVTNSTLSYAGVINEAYERSTAFTDYPENDLSAQLSIIARLIKGGLGSKIYMVSLDGFDTHNNQLERQQELITNLSETISHFYNDLASAGWDDKVISMTISEFGRRLTENGSGGTDHGTGSSVLLFGPALEGNGFIGEHPDINEPDTIGNLNYTTDFRQIYTTMLKDWLCADSDLVDTALLGTDYDSLDLGFSCTNSSNQTLDPESVASLDSLFRHTPFYSDNQVFINLNIPTSQHIDISLYNMLGQRVAVLRNDIFFEGEHIININEQTNGNLKPGQYIYQITTSTSKFSKSIII